MKKLILPIVFLALLFGAGCGEKKENQSKQSEEEAKEVSIDPMKDKGIGPIKNLVIPETIDEEMAKKGEEHYITKCSACHKATKTYIGPAPVGILDRRTPEWVMNMILNPEEMIAKNAIAKQLLLEYNNAPMANQNLTEEEARAILEYFRTLK